MALISSPATWSDRMAASRPLPGPLTRTSTVVSPKSIASLAACMEACWAAKGVLLRDPLNPLVPPLAHEMTLPYWFVSVITVLLKVALM